VAIGNLAGFNDQGNDSIAIGYQAGKFFQGINSVAIGDQAGFCDQSNNSVAIGFGAGFNSQANNSIIISARGAIIDNTGYDNTIVIYAGTKTINIECDSAFYVEPIRKPPNVTGWFELGYCDVTYEIVKM
jgi:hypothetical protein